MSSKISIIIAAAILAIIAAVALVAFSTPSASQNGAPKIEASPANYDMGTVSMAKGLAPYTVKIENKGDADLEIKKIYTSCMCTTAKMKIDGVESPAFGMPGHGSANPFWKGKIPAGGSAEMEIVFDPNAHGHEGVGAITRSITLETNDPARPKFNLMFSGNVTH
jgi:hypothetical protein